jgi:hypothetical protein
MIFSSGDHLLISSTVRYLMRTVRLTLQPDKFV